MSNPTIKIHNVETDEVIEREMNAEELAEYKADKLAAEIRLRAQAEVEAKRSVLLEKLGITEEEAKLLLS